MPEPFKAKTNSGLDGTKRQPGHFTNATVGDVIEIGSAQRLGLFWSKARKRFGQVLRLLL